jgi:hypothetical protein
MWGSALNHLSVRDDIQQGRRSSVNDDVLTFDALPDSQNPPVQLGYRVFGAVALSAILVASVLGAVGIITFNQTLYIVGSSIVGGVFLAFVFRAYYRYTVRVDAELVMVESQSSRLSFARAEVTDCRVGDESPRLYSLLRINTRPCVIVKLARRPRSSLLSILKTDVSTDRRFGLPTAYKRLAFYVRDADGLAAAIGSSPPTE